MQAYTDKSQEKYRQATAGEMAYRAGHEIPDQFRDQRPEAAAQRKVQQLANDNARVRQLKALQAMTRAAVQTSTAAAGTAKHSRAHVDKASHARAPDNQAVIQGRFTGPLGGVMSVLTPAALGATGTYYNNLWNVLNASDTEIEIKEGSVASFNPQSNTLYVKGHILRALLDHRNGTRLAADVLADHVALITHELSHAHDSIVGGRELKGERGTDDALVKIANVMMTEVQAWEREARTRQRLLPGDRVDPLWEGWLNLEPAMLTDFGALKAHKATNDVVNRYFRYLARELTDVDGDVGRVGTWFANHGATVGAEIMRLATALAEARDTI